MSEIQPVLEVSQLSKAFGGVRAVNDVSFDVGRGEIVGLIGPNGAGKTTIFNLISGRFPPTSGEVRFLGKVLTGLRPDRISQRGISRTFQGTRIFGKLSVLDNVRTAMLAGSPIGFWSGWLNLPSARRAVRDADARALELLDWIGLAPQRDLIAGNLAYAHQSLLGISLALARNPQLLLLDEPFAGMNPGETLAATEMVRRIRERGITVVLVEHDMSAVMRVCERIVVLDHGVKIAEGAPDQIKRNPEVVRAYLGADEDA